MAAAISSTLKQRISESYYANPRWFLARVALALGVLYILVFWRAFWTPDLLFFIFLLLFTLYGQGRQFLYKFGPFVLLLLSYDSLRGLAPYLNKNVHFTEMIDFDRWIGFGHLPTTVLQGWLYPGHITILDFYFYGLYMCHFVSPLIVGIVIWKLRPAYFNRYIAAFILLSYAAFVTYILFPAAPPWMAAEKGFIEPIHKISTNVWFALGVHDFPTIYKQFSPNLVAAVPSLHSAYPLLIVLFIGRAFGAKWGWIFSWYPISIWIGVVYMGEHYLFDAVVGAAYAVTAYYVTNWLFNRYGVRARATHARIKARFRKPVTA